MATAVGIVFLSHVKANVKTSSLLLQNIEALAKNESGKEKKEKLIKSDYDCVIVIDLGNGGYFHKNGTYWGCTNDPQGVSTCASACVANQ